MGNKECYILGIESSCDDTSAAVLRNDSVLSNVIANQDVHKAYGGVVPELASRAHEQNIIPVVDAAIRQAGITADQVSAVAFTQGPGLLGSLLVGAGFAKSFALAKDIPLIGVNHLHGHIFAHFLKPKGKENSPPPDFPFLCLLISGGHTQIVRVNGFMNFEILGQTIDDAAGEAFDKAAKIMGLPYPGGPVIDKLAHSGNPDKFALNKPRIPGLDFSFSGLKTSFLYMLRDALKKDRAFIEKNKCDLAASLQHTIIDILSAKLIEASRLTGIHNIAVSGGVSANSGLRTHLTDIAKPHNWDLYLPEKSYTTDNAAMIALIAYYKFLNKAFANQETTPTARLAFGNGL